MRGRTSTSVSAHRLTAAGVCRLPSRHHPTERRIAWFLPCYIPPPPHLPPSHPPHFLRPRVTRLNAAPFARRTRSLGERDARCFGLGFRFELDVPSRGFCLTILGHAVPGGVSGALGDAGSSDRPVNLLLLGFDPALLVGLVPAHRLFRHRSHRRICL